MIRPAERLESIQEYYFSTKLREVRNLTEAGRPIINLGIGSPDLRPSNLVIEAIKASLDKPFSHMYQSYQGTPDFRGAIATFYKNQYDVVLDSNSEILPLMGSKEGILQISLAFLNKGDAVLIPNPGYPTYTSVTNLVGATPIFYDLTSENKWQPDFEALELEDLSKVKIMWINYPHMPTGANAKNKTFERLIAFAKKHQILLVNDNPYSFILNESPQSILQYEGAMDCALELNSLSKSFNMAGWRVGMLLGNQSYLQEVLKVKTQSDSGMFFGIQQGAISALSLGSEWFATQNKIYEERRKFVWLLAEELGCEVTKNATGLFVWAQVPAKMTAEEMTDKLLYEYDIFVAPGTVFGTNGEGFIRFSLCVNSDLIETAINRIKKRKS